MFKMHTCLYYILFALVLCDRLTLYHMVARGVSRPNEWTVDAHIYEFHLLEQKLHKNDDNI